MRTGDLLRDRKFYLLAGLVILLVILNLSQWRKSGNTSVRNQNKQSTASVLTSGDPTLLADRLTSDRLEFREEKRNIFTFFDKRASAQTAVQTQPVAPPPPPPVCGNSVCEADENLSNCPTDCQPPPPPAPVITLRYIGFVSEPTGSVAFLTDGKAVYMGRVNDVIANQYRVLKITEDSVELGFLNNNQSNTIRFQGSQGG